MKRLVIHLIVFAVGAGVGFLVGQKMLDEKYAKLAQDEIDDVKKTFDKIHKKRVSLTKKEGDVVNDHPPGEDPRLQDVTLPKSSLDLSRTNPYEDAKQNYNLVSREDDKCEKTIYDIFEALVVGNEEDLSKVDRSKPYPITRQVFEQEILHNDVIDDQVCLVYWLDDEVLSDEDDQVFEDGDRHLGRDNVNMIHKYTPIWIRNERMFTDYEIVAHEDAYWEAVHGEKRTEDEEDVDEEDYAADESPKERYNKTNNKKKKGKGKKNGK